MKKDKIKITEEDRKNFKKNEKIRKEFEALYIDLTLILSKIPKPTLSKDDLKYTNLMVHFGSIEKNTPLYREALHVLKRYSTVPKSIIDIFKDDKLLADKYESPHIQSGYLRVQFLRSITLFGF